MKNILKLLSPVVGPALPVGPTRLTGGSQPTAGALHHHRAGLHPDVERKPGGRLLICQVLPGSGGCARV